MSQLESVLNSEEMKLYVSFKLWAGYIGRTCVLRNLLLLVLYTAIMCEGGKTTIEL